MLLLLLLGHATICQPGPAQAGHLPGLSVAASSSLPCPRSPPPPEIVYEPATDSVRVLNKAARVEYATEVGKDNRIAILLDQTTELPGGLPSFPQLQVPIWEGTCCTSGCCCGAEAGP